MASGPGRRSPEFVLDESADVAAVAPACGPRTRPRSRHRGARSLAAQPGGGLEGGDDEFLELPAGVQGGKGVDHRHDRRPGLAMIPNGRSLARWG